MKRKCLICGTTKTQVELVELPPLDWCVRCYRSWCKGSVRNFVSAEIAEWAARRARAAERRRQKRSRPC